MKVVIFNKDEGMHWNQEQDLYNAGPIDTIFEVARDLGVDDDELDYIVSEYHRSGHNLFDIGVNGSVTYSFALPQEEINKLKGLVA